MKKTAEFIRVASRAIIPHEEGIPFVGRENANAGPGKKRAGSVGKRTRLVKYDDLTLSAIRKKIHGFFREGEIPTAKKVCSVINKDPYLPNFTGETLTREIRRQLELRLSGIDELE